MKIALLFPGQGAQYVGMGKELYETDLVAKEIYEKANHYLDWDVKEVCFQDKNGLIHQTRYTQGALFTTNYAIYRVFQKTSIQADAVLGFSLGEYNALVACGSLTFENALSLVDLRAQYMENCAIQTPGGMSAIIGMETKNVYELCRKVSEQIGSLVTVANDNCEGQVTIAGEQIALEKAHTLFKEAGARRIVPLKVSGAFHSPLMQEAAQKLKVQLNKVDFNAPQIPIVSNVTAEFVNAQEIKENIPHQITHGVRFRESILYLIAQGFDTFIEIGPKCTLSHLVSKISKEVNVFQVENIETLNEVVQKVGGSYVKR